MTYEESVEHLYSLGPELPSGKMAAGDGATGATSSRRKFDLAHMRILCASLGDPQKRFPSILIAGTNGKGSTAATLASILTTAGYRTGLYTSPHLVEPTERIQMGRAVMPSEYGSAQAHGADGPLVLTAMTEHEFARLYTRVNEACTTLVEEGRLEVTPSFFERLTAMAFLAYAGSETATGVEIAVLEVGLGGRLDATNVVEPVLTVITDIALDHQEYLGTTIGAIAREKCGILRAGVPLVTLPQHPEANQAIGEMATALGLDGVSAAVYLPPALRNDAGPTGAGNRLPRNRYTVSIEDATEAGWVSVDSPLYGVHQQRNLALAIAAAVAIRNRSGSNFENSFVSDYKFPKTPNFIITNAAIEAGIQSTQWPGRLEWIEPDLLLDVAHNPAGAWTLRSAIASLPSAMPRTLIFSCLRDKSLEEMSKILFPLFDSSEGGDPERREDHVILAPIASPRAAAVEDLLAAAHALGVPAHAAPHVEAAVVQARQVTPANGVILATGSVYLVGEVRQMVLKNKVSAGGV